jgi:ferredoxin--NADP+ reductase
MKEDVEGRVAAPGPSRDAIVELLCSRGIDYVTYEDWQQLDADEVRRGSEKGKVREKYCRIEEMLETVRRLREEAVSSS